MSGDPSRDARIKAERARQQRASWEKQGRATRAEYNRAPTAMPRWVQDEIVDRHRRGDPRNKILRDVGARYRPLNEYHVKRILRVFQWDPAAFKVAVSPDIVAWCRSVAVR